MTDLRKAAEMALEALQVMKAGHHEEEKAYIDNVIEALRQALAQPEQEPVAWMHTCGSDTQINTLPAECYGDNWTRTPLYTAPPKREWVGLTVEERRHFNNRLSGSGVAEEIEAKLKERQL